MNNEESWIFTFGFGDYPFSGKCVRIQGDFNMARQKMFDLVGSEWGFQYSEEEWEKMKNDPDRLYPLEQEISLEEVVAAMRNGEKAGDGACQ